MENVRKCTRRALCLTLRWWYKTDPGLHSMLLLDKNYITIKITEHKDPSSGSWEEAGKKTAGLLFQHKAAVGSLMEKYLGV